MRKIKLIATDLDGTFLKNDHSISANDLNTLRLLGEKGIKRVIATGRNLKKVRNVIPSHIPFDYIIYSSGAGIYDCNARKHIFSKNISKEISKGLVSLLMEMDISFNAFLPVPENHHLWYHRGTYACEEFEDYFKFHNSHSSPLPKLIDFESELCQVLIILPNEEPLFNRLKGILMDKYKDLGVIRDQYNIGVVNHK